MERNSSLEAWREEVHSYSQKQEKVKRDGIFAERRLTQYGLDLLRRKVVELEDFNLETPFFVESNEAEVPEELLRKLYLMGNWKYSVSNLGLAETKFGGPGKTHFRTKFDLVTSGEIAGIDFLYPIRTYGGSPRIEVNWLKTLIFDLGKTVYNESNWENTKTVLDARWEALEPLELVDFLNSLASAYAEKASIVAVR